LLAGDPIEYVRREIEEAEEKFHAGEYAASLPLLLQIIHILEEHPATHKRAMTPGPNTADEKKLPSVDRLPYTYFHHGIVSLALFDFVAANKTAKRIIQLRPRWWQGYYLLCDSHCRMEEWHKALKAITFCFDLYVPDGDAEEVVRYYDYLQDKVQHVIERSAANTTLNSAVNTATNTARSMVDDNDHDIELQEGI
jgi:hypothetical protein